MPVVDQFEREIAAARARALAIEQHAAGDLLRAYAPVHRRLKANLADLQQRIVHARRAGVEVRPGWLFAEERYRVLLADLDQGAADFAKAATEATVTAQRESVNAARERAPRLAVAAAGPAPDAARRSLLDTFARVPHGTLAHLVGYTADGRPLGDLLATLAPRAVNDVRDALAFGVATGRPVRQITRDVVKASTATPERAVGIVRTEVIRASRAAAGDMFRRSRVVQQWVWWAAPDARTCPACWAMHGTVHPISETLSSHPLCRCTMVPRTRSWSELGFDGIPDRRPTVPTGQQLFRKLPVADQRRVLGPTRYRLWRAGAVRFDELARVTRDDRWGDGLKVATLAELGVS